MNKLLKKKGVVALLYNEAENLADMEGEKDFETLKKRCGMVKRAIWEAAEYLEKQQAQELKEF